MTQSYIAANPKPLEDKKEVHHRAETWNELFYDLIFVAAAIQIGLILKCELSSVNVSQAAVLFLILRTTWEHLMLYQNRFDSADMLHYTFYLLQAMCAYVMTLHLSILDSDDHHWNAHDNVKAFSIAAAFARFLNVIMYFHVFYHTEEFRVGFRTYLLTVTYSQLIAGILYIIASFANTFAYFYTYLVLWGVALFVESPLVSIITTIIQKRRKRSGRIPDHFTHMVHRSGTFILLISGEAIIQLVQSALGFTTYDYIRGCLGFAIVYDVGVCYYQQQKICLENPTIVKETPFGYIWIGLHSFLSLTILFFAVGIKLVYVEVQYSERNLLQEYFMTVNASLSLLLIFILRIMHKGLPTLKRRLRLFSYSFRFIIASMIAFIPLFTTNSTSTVIVLFVLSLVLVIQVSFIKYF